MIGAEYPILLSFLNQQFGKSGYCYNKIPIHCKELKILDLNTCVPFPPHIENAKIIKTPKA